MAAEIATLCEPGPDELAVEEGDPPGIAARRSNARARCAVSERERYQGKFANARSYQEAHESPHFR